jgi:glycosyltransferase involved in cell wall biosynthesis
VADERNRRAARDRTVPLSWKYPIYHGGLRLWEVRRSLVLADRCVLLNTFDRDYVHDRLGVPAERLVVIPNAIADHFHDVAAPRPVDGPLKLAYVGRWSWEKGSPTLVDAVRRLADGGQDFRLTLLGTGAPPEIVRNDFPVPMRSRVSVTPFFRNQTLPGLLQGQEVFVFPSLSEGSSASLLEAMGCGAAPVATPVGSAPQLLDGSNGLLVEAGDASGFHSALERLARDRQGLLEMRHRAQQTARSFHWKDVAAQTIEVYESSLASRDRRMSPASEHGEPFPTRPT